MNAGITLNVSAEAARSMTPAHVADSAVDHLNKVDWLSPYHSAWKPKMSVAGRELESLPASSTARSEVRSLIVGIELKGRPMSALLKDLDQVHCAKGLI